LIRDDDISNIPWSCGGHPPATLPVSIDGTEITRFSDLETILRERLDHPRENVLNLFHERLAGTPLESSVGDIATRFLSDSDPLAKGKALGFFCSYPQTLGARRAFELAQGDRSGFAGVPDSRPIDGCPTLEGRLVLTVGRLWTERVLPYTEALELLRRDALRRETSCAVIETLGQLDYQWLRDHADEIATAAPNAIGMLLVQLHGNRWPSEPVDLIAVAKRAVGLSPEERAAVRKEITLYISSREPIREPLLAVFGEV
jgi:hypothetical protein